MHFSRRALSVAVGLRAAHSAVSFQSSNNHEKNLVKATDRVDSYKANHDNHHAAVPSEEHHLLQEHEKPEKITLMDNPIVIIGAGMTLLALLGGCYKLLIGDKSGLQNMLRYRVYAQAFTLLALVGGVIYSQIKRDMKKSKDK